MALTTRIEALLGERVGRLSHWGGPDVPVASPSDEAELAELLDAVRADGLCALPLGNGTKLGAALVPDAVDLAVSTRRLRGIVQYEPAEGVLTARAGTTLRELRRATAAAGHHLAPELPQEDRATLGGVVSAAPSGADRLRYGPVRDQVLGLRLATSDGRVVRSGGALVKDVAGYDLAKLVCGAHGSFGVVTEVSLRLYPLPSARVLLRRRVADLAEGFELASVLRERLSAPRGLRLDGAADAVWLTADLAGRPPVVEDQLERALAVVGSARALRGDAARRVAGELRDARHAGGTWPQLGIDALPSRLGGALDAALAASGADARVEVHPALGLAWLRLAADPSREQAFALDRAVRAAGAVPRWCGLAAALRRELAEASPTPAGAALARRLRAALDPSATFAAPRLHPKL